MPWFKVDDKLHSHRKVRAAGTKALGLWVLAGSWCMDNDYDGFIPAEVIKVWSCTKADAQRLVDAGLWKVATHKGEEGWRFHDWARFQPSAAVTAAKKAKEAEAGLRGNHKRWHEDRGITDPDCEYCYRVPDGEPDSDPIAPTDDVRQPRASRSEITSSQSRRPVDVTTNPESSAPREVSTEIGHVSAKTIGYPIGSASGPGESPPNRPVPVPDPLPHVSPDGDTSRGIALVERDDVERICEHLANRIEANGSKRPTVTAKWRTEARLLLDTDKRLEADVHAAIDWCQADAFWRSNILSMPKLRQKYDQLRLSATRTNGPRRGDIDWDAAFARAAAKTEGELQ